MSYSTRALQRNLDSSKSSQSPYLVELWRVDPCCVVVEQQLKAELRYGHGPDIGHFEQILNGGTAVDVHGSGVCSGLQQHLHQEVIAVPGCLVESRLMVLLLEVWVCVRRAVEQKPDPETSLLRGIQTFGQF